MGTEEEEEDYANADEEDDHNGEEEDDHNEKEERRRGREATTICLFLNWVLLARI